MMPVVIILQSLINNQDNFEQHLSYMDTYELLSFEDDVDLDESIMVHVRLISDKPTVYLDVTSLGVYSYGYNSGRIGQLAAQ